MAPNSNMSNLLADVGSRARLATILPNKSAQFYKMLLSGIAPDAAARSLKSLTWVQNLDDDPVFLGDDRAVDDFLEEDDATANVPQRLLHGSFEEGKGLCWQKPKPVRQSH